MHGLVNRAIQCFVRDTYGWETWLNISDMAKLGFDSFESMLMYDDSATYRAIGASAQVLDLPTEEILENIGIYLVSHPNMSSARRLLRFGGETYVEFLHSLDDLHDRARLAVDDIGMPVMELLEYSSTVFALTVHTAHAGFGYVVMGVLQALADDFGVLVTTDHYTRRLGEEVINISIIDDSFARGREFDLGIKGAA